MSFQGLTGHETLTRLVGKRRNLRLSHTTSFSSTAAIASKDEIASSASCTSTLSGVEVKIQHHVREIIKNPDDFIEGQGEGSPGENLVANNTLIQAGGDSKEHVEQKHSNELEWVHCPICWRSIRTDVVNTHIDVCLQGGDIRKKRKQLTLPQCGSALTCKYPTARAKAQRGTATKEITESTEYVTSDGSLTSERLSSGSDLVGKSRIDDIANDISVEDHLRHCLALSPDPKMGITLVANEEVKCLHSSHGTRLQGDSLFGKLGNLAPDTVGHNTLKESALTPGLDRCVCECHSSSVKANGQNAPETQVYSKEHDPEVDSAASEKTRLLGRSSDSPEDHGHTCFKPACDPLRETLHTIIVGRKFNRRTNCNLGMKITVLREADNPMDSNAIKVVQMENPMSFKLGHLSRDISFHLSTLLEKGYLKVWGVVTALPDQAFGPVPITLFCETMMDKEAFLKLDGAEDNLRNAVIASKSPPQRPQERVSKYQQNFSLMLHAVLERDPHLFTAEEKDFLEIFASLGDESQRLFIRLYQRKGPWFRLSALAYMDVTNIVDASTELLAKGYITAKDYSDETPEVSLTKKFEILNVTELRQLVCGTTMMKKTEAASLKKDDLIKMAVTAGLQKHWNLISGSTNERGPNIVRLLEEISGPCIRVSDRADFLLWRVKRLFFLNGEADLSSFLVVDMGLLKYPRYRCWGERKVFESREALLAYEQALEVAQRMDVALEKNDCETALRFFTKARQELISIDDTCQMPAATTPTFLGRFSASYIYKQVCTLGISILERERRYLEAVDVLRQLLSKYASKSGRWGYWTVRLSIDLDHLGRKEESLRVAEMGVSDPWIRGGDLVALQRRVARLGKPPRRWKIPPYVAGLKKSCKEVHIQGRPLNSEIGAKSWFYGYDGEQCRVEELALQHYASEVGGGWRGLHCEGGVWMTLFGILMWDILFADVPDVFQNSFQTSPLDLGTEVFFSSRECLIEAKLADIAKADSSSLLAQTWNQNFGTSCRGVNWERYTLEQLQEISQCIGGPGLSAVCRLLAEDYAGWSGGMPDLLLWRLGETSQTKHDAPGGPQLPELCFACGCASSAVSCARGEDMETACEDSPHLPIQMQQRQDTSVDAKLCRMSDAVHQIPKRNNNHGKAKLVEVKGPRDRLSEQQRAWIWILMNAGLDVEVCKVVELALE